MMAQLQQTTRFTFEKAKKNDCLALQWQKDKKLSGDIRIIGVYTIYIFFNGNGLEDNPIYHRNLNTFVAVITSPPPPPFLLCRYF